MSIGRFAGQIFRHGYGDTKAAQLIRGSMDALPPALMALTAPGGPNLGVFGENLAQNVAVTLGAGALSNRLGRRFFPNDPNKQELFGTAADLGIGTVASYALPQFALTDAINKEAMRQSERAQQEAVLQQLQSEAEERQLQQQVLYGGLATASGLLPQVPFGAVPPAAPMAAADFVNTLI